MMAEKKIVTVNGICPASMKSSEIDDLCDVLSTLPEYDYNILIISVPSGGIDEGFLPKKPSAQLTKLCEHLTPVRFDPISPSRLVSWISKHFAHNGVQVSTQLCSFITEYCGASMFTLASEIDKLSYYSIQKGIKELTPDHVREVCTPEISTDTFSLANAILSGNGEAALDALSVMKFRRVDPVLILPEISRVIGDLITIKSFAEEGRSAQEISAALKMNEYKVKIYMNSAASKSMDRLKKTLNLCSEADISLKLSPKGYTAIETLICAL